jgi:hypothetical protein
MSKRLKRVYLGDHVFKELIAMDEAPARATERDDGDDSPTYADLHAALDEAQEHLEAARKVIESGQRSGGDKAFSFDSVKRRVADARDCMDRLDGHLGGKLGARDSEPVDHRRDFDPHAIDSALGLAFDFRRVGTSGDLIADIFGTRE